MMKRNDGPSGLVAARLALALAVGCGVAMAQARELNALTAREPSYQYDCSVERRLKAYTISLTRLYTDEGALKAGDFMYWRLGSGKYSRPLNIALSYIWPPEKQPAIELRAVNLQFQLYFETDLPEVTLFQVQRPFPVEPYGVVDRAALSSMVFPHSATGHGDLPLGDLLAYAEGYESLEWKLTRLSDHLGGLKELARGTIDIAALREAMSALPELRKALAVKTEQPKARCERKQVPDIPMHP